MKESEDVEAIGDNISKEEEDEGDVGKENRLDDSLRDVSCEAVASTEEPTPIRKTVNASKNFTLKIRRRRVRAKRSTSGTSTDKKLPFVNSDFKLPQPRLGHSTPGDIGPSAIPRRDSLFGFGVLESPLLLSPVPSLSYNADDTPEQKNSPEETKPKSASVGRVLGTYDIPIRKPTPRNRKRQKTKTVS